MKFVRFPFFLPAHFGNVPKARFIATLARSAFVAPVGQPQQSLGFFFSGSGSPSPAYCIVQAPTVDEVPAANTTSPGEGLPGSARTVAPLTE